MGAAQFSILASSNGRFNFVPPGPQLAPDSVRVARFGYVTEVFKNVHLSSRDHLLKLDGNQPVVVPIPTPVSPSLPAPITAPILVPTPAPYHLVHSASASTNVPPGACRMLKLVKLDDEVGYVIVRVSFAIYPPL